MWQAERVMWKWTDAMLLLLLILFFLLSCSLFFLFARIVLLFFSVSVLPSPTEYDSAPHSIYLLMGRGRVNKCDRAVMYVPAKAREGQRRDRRCHILTFLSVSATSWTFLLSHFLSHRISILSFLPCASLPIMCCVCTVTLLSSFPLHISLIIPLLFVKLHHYKTHILLVQNAGIWINNLYTPHSRCLVSIVRKCLLIVDRGPNLREKDGLYVYILNWINSCHCVFSTSFFHIFFSPHSRCPPKPRTYVAHMLLYMCVWLQPTGDSATGNCVAEPSKEKLGQIGLSTTLNLLIILKTRLMLPGAAQIDWNS